MPTSCRCCFRSRFISRDLRGELRAQFGVPGLPYQVLLHRQLRRREAGRLPTCSRLSSPKRCFDRRKQIVEIVDALDQPRLALRTAPPASRAILRSRRRSRRKPHRIAAATSSSSVKAMAARISRPVCPKTKCVEGDIVEGGVESDRDGQTNDPGKQRMLHSDPGETRRAPCRRLPSSCRGLTEDTKARVVPTITPVSTSTRLRYSMFSAMAKPIPDAKP